MAIHVALTHRTSYTYDRAIHLGPHVVRLRPAPHARTPILDYSLRVEPAQHYINWQQDPFGNFLARLVFPRTTTKFSVEVSLLADMTVINPFDFFTEPSADAFPFAYEPELRKELAPYLVTETPTPRLAKWIAALPKQMDRTNDFLVTANQRVSENVSYLIRMEPGVQTPEETLTIGSGSCRDSAWLLATALRHIGLATRFVSGYLMQLKPDVDSLDGPTGATEDFADLHAWCEVYVPGAGWIGLDPTSGLLTGEGHIPLAATPSPSSAAPITGGLDECEVSFDFEVSVARVLEDPRVTRPYSDAQWAAVRTLGERVDARLIQDDVRLTMGGEPTFVSVDDMDGEEWMTAAVGRDKRRLSGKLVDRLRDRFATGGLMHFGQGKWYPGESLPRWCFACYWRKDGAPIWNDPSLVAGMEEDLGHGADEAQRFAEHLAGRLGVSGEHLVPAYEDAMYNAWQENRLPPNMTAGDAKASTNEDRRRLAGIFEAGLDTPCGWVMPLQAASMITGDDGWVTSAWPVRSEHMFLAPGDSPMGLRLPLESLTHMPEARQPHSMPVDPTIPTEPLAPPILQRARVTTPERAGELVESGVGISSAVGRGDAQAPGSVGDGGRGGRGGSVGSVGSMGGDGSVGDGHDLPPGSILDAVTTVAAAPDIVRTALCVEPRNGHLHVFMPPVDRLEDYLDLIGAVELTASELALPVIVEGYAPPHDPRIDVIKVTPDPGVIEVNVHPAASWDELVGNTLAFYDEARACRLGAEKFDLDGTHTGTGGGNHVVLGGATPMDSPFLRRPDMLGSLVSYWLSHPSLSYLFSSRFIGPTSQAPRVDEGRPDALAELDIALRTMNEAVRDGGEAPPWLVDRIFRHLLTDLTGNTHRAEICIDKLYSPDSVTGRLGLVELRGFEMPPHPQMSLTQQLLIRSLVAHFWRRPVRRPVANWGTALHDRFMLPHFLWADLCDVLEDLREDDMDLDAAWFRPHLEFRCPKIGTFVRDSVELELRSALEPWYVLGEEAGGGGTSRAVDSSIERLQVQVDGMIEGRHVVTCNGRPLPLHPTGVAGRFVAGVRYRAWCPPRCLHPTIPVHSPLVIDLVDTWRGRSMGGCTYHVSHPGGLNPSRFPVNAYEAESRRAARFTDGGHTSGRIEPVAERTNRAFPMTLDLRQPVIPG